MQCSSFTHLCIVSGKETLLSDWRSCCWCQNVHSSRIRGGSTGGARGQSPSPRRLLAKKSRRQPAWVNKPAFDRPGDARPIQFPTVCPVIYSSLVWILAPRMHQNSPFLAQKSKRLPQWGGGHRRAYGALPRPQVSPFAAHLDPPVSRSLMERRSANVGGQQLQGYNNTRRATKKLHQGSFVARQAPSKITVFCARYCS